MHAETWLRIVSCSDWVESCYDEQSPVPSVDMSSLLADAQYLAMCTVAAVIAFRVIAAAVGVLVVFSASRRGR